MRHHYTVPLGMGISRLSGYSSTGAPILQQLILTDRRHYTMPLGTGIWRSSGCSSTEAPILAATNRIGETPLHQASKTGHLDIVNLLLDKGADVTVANNYGWTPLISAVSDAQVDVVKLLLAIDRSGPYLKDTIGRTPLFYAANNGAKAIVELLLAINRVDVDSKDYYNSTPLSIAARMGHGDVVALFLTKSHALNIEDNFGRTPLWWAKKNGYPEIADLLLKKSRENGIFIQNGLPITTISVLANKAPRLCDVCILGVLEKDTYYHCSVCNDGDFDICKECFAMKAHCLDESHTIYHIIT